MEKKNKQKYIFWSIFGFLFLWFIYYASSAIKPFLLGFVLAYLFLPVINRLHKMHISRGLSSAAIVIGLFTIITLGIFAILPFLYERFVFLLKELLNSDNSTELEWIRKISKILNIEDDVIGRIYDYLYTSISDFASREVKVSNSQSVLSFFITIIGNFFIMPIIMFYILKDWLKIKKSFFSLVPFKNREAVQDIVFQINDSITSYLKGQLAICFFFMIFYSTSLYAIGLNFGIIIGLIIGVMLFIPYIGFLIASASTLVISYIQFGGGVETLIVLSIFLIGQIIDINYTTPKFIANKIGLHPVWVVFGLCLSTVLLGFTGSVISLPLTASVAVLVRFFVDKYKGSHYYCDHAG